MFEVGKRYRSANGNEYECTAVGQNMALLAYDEYSEYSVKKREFQHYTEIRPKRRIEAWVNVYDHMGELQFGILHRTKQESIDLTSDIKMCIGTIKIKYEEK